PGGARPVFATTHWSVVRAAGAEASAAAHEALETLCRAYWPPLYAYARRRGHGPEEALDLTQEFFLRLVERRWTNAADPAQGRFRSFLLGAFNHFLANERHHARARKRGGQACFLPLDAGEAETALGGTAATTDTPETLYERRWAETLIAGVLRRLAGEYAAHPHGWENLRPFVVETRREHSLLATAARLGVSESALRSVVHRLRRRWQELVREEVAHTVADPADIEPELRHLITLFQV
ncbi:MAG TPA: sigma-70 family RNA polymerase sigma factor, partial [Verrucomicrobiota bacterium]|nr:sigma-70 family RNA polymerase sigma factor [Verrucomicrobiota bacterium]